MCSTLCAAVLQVPLASIPQFYFPGGAEPVDEDVKQQFVVNVNALFDPHPNGLNLEQFSAVVQEVRRNSRTEKQQSQLVSSICLQQLLVGSSDLVADEQVDAGDIGAVQYELWGCSL
jgi:hypothetical protein